MPLKVVELEIKGPVLRLDLKTMVRQHRLVEKQGLQPLFLEQTRSPFKQPVFLEPKQAAAQVSKESFAFGNVPKILLSI